MILLGDLAGIQDYVFDVKEDGGGQARQLRARSFALQLHAEILALRLAEELGGSEDSVWLAGAGKFTLYIKDPRGMETLPQRVAEWQQKICAETAGRARFACVWSTESLGSAVYQELLKQLHNAKSRPFHWAADANGWNQSRLVLDFFDRDRQAEHMGDLGKKLAGARWLVLRPDQGSDAVLGYKLELQNTNTPSVGGAWAVGDLNGGGEIPPKVRRDALQIKRRMARHIPTDNGHPVEFIDLARRARGDRLLGVLKADGDGLGNRFRDCLKTNSGLEDFKKLAQRLDDFFGIEMDRLWKTEFPNLYMVFSGGDDLVAVGPWDQVLAAAGRLREKFTQAFSGEELTLSAGVTCIKPKDPIRFAIAHAEDLLHKAKHLAPYGRTPKDQCAALNQVWKWEHHAAIIEQGRKISGWVDAKLLPRSGLHTLLELIVKRFDDKETAESRLLAVAHLSYYFARHLPDRSDPKKPLDSDQRAFCQWADYVRENIDRPPVGCPPDIQYLEASLRYALLATRSEDSREGATP
jgi:CRISPR-associated protein Csm1